MSLVSMWLPMKSDRYSIQFGLILCHCLRVIEAWPICCQYSWVIGSLRFVFFSDNSLMKFGLICWHFVGQWFQCCFCT